jgi:hypothetical protein
MNLGEKISAFKNAEPHEYKAMRKTLARCDGPMRGNKEGCSLLVSEQELTLAVNFINSLSEDEWEEFTKNEIF